MWLVRSNYSAFNGGEIVCLVALVISPRILFAWLARHATAHETLQIRPPNPGCEYERRKHLLARNLFSYLAESVCFSGLGS